jgi:hypothetical protein
MFRKAAIVLAITLASLSAARAEDPDEGVIERFHTAVIHWPVEAPPRRAVFRAQAAVFSKLTDESRSNAEA